MSGIGQGAVYFFLIFSSHALFLGSNNLVLSSTGLVASRVTVTWLPRGGCGHIWHPHPSDGHLGRCSRPHPASADQYLCLYCLGADG